MERMKTDEQVLQEALAARGEWPLYLRVLDATAAGASDDEIAAVFECSEIRVRDLRRKAKLMSANYLEVAGAD